MKYIIFVLAFITFIPNLYPQNKQIIKREGKFANEIFKEIFESYPDVVRVDVEYINGIPLYLDLYKKPSGKNNNQLESYLVQYMDLKFEGDIHYFYQEYKLDLPVFSRDKLEFFEKLKSYNADYKVVSTIYKDSIHYKFFQSCSDGNIVFDRKKHMIFGEGDSLIREIEEYCEKTFKNNDLNINLFFQGIIEKTGSLTDVQAVRATRTAAEQTILKKLQQSGHFWQPAIQGGRPVRSALKFFVTLKEGRCQITTAGGTYTPITKTKY